MKNKKKALFLSLVAALGIASCSHKSKNNNEDTYEEHEIVSVMPVEEKGIILAPITEEPVLTEEPIVTEEPVIVPYGYTLIDNNIVRDKSIFIPINYYAYVKEESPLLNTPNNDDIIGYIDEYQKVYIMSTNDDYHYIETSEGIICYIKSENVEILPGNYVEVDISDQQLKVYNDYIEVLNTNVVTGSPNTPTDLGYTEILEKTYDRPLVGSTWNVHVNYFFPFNYDGEGFHDADGWRSVYGGEIYTYNGSHGCVNMSLKDVEELDNHIEVGTKVLVHK